MVTISAKQLYLRPVQIEDTDFIFYLRRHPEKSKYLSPVGSDINEQKDWIKQYKIREQQKLEYYFIACLMNGEKVGTIRVYDLRSDSFSWGSWISAPEVPKGTGIKMMLMVYDFGFNYLKYPKSHFEVLKGNEKSVSFHKRFGARITSEDALRYYFSITKNEYEQAKLMYKEIYQTISVKES